MGDRHVRPAHVHRIGAPLCAAVELKARRAAAAHDLDVPPEHAVRMAGAERFHGRFLRGETAGKVRHGVTAAGTIRNFAVGEDTTQKTVAVAREDLRDARNVGGVEPDADDVHAWTPA